MTKVASRKNKGRLGQQEVRDAILKFFPELEPDDVRSTAMGQSGEDLQLSPKAREYLPVSFEIKRRKGFETIYNFYNQAKQDDKYEPIVALRADYKPWLVVLSLDHYLNMQRCINDKQ